MAEYKQNSYLKSSVSISTNNDVLKIADKSFYKSIDSYLPLTMINPEPEVLQLSASGKAKLAWCLIAGAITVIAQDIFFASADKYSTSYKAIAMLIMSIVLLGVALHIKNAYRKIIFFKATTRVPRIAFELKYAKSNSGLIEFSEKLSKEIKRARVTAHKKCYGLMRDGIISMQAENLISADYANELNARLDQVIPDIS